VAEETSQLYQSGRSMTHRTVVHLPIGNKKRGSRLRAGGRGFGMVCGPTAVGGPIWQRSRPSYVAPLAPGFMVDMPAECPPSAS